MKFLLNVKRESLLRWCTTCFVVTGVTFGVEHATFAECLGEVDLTCDLSELSFLNTDEFDLEKSVVVPVDQRLLKLFGLLPRLFLIDTAGVDVVECVSLLVLTMLDEVAAPFDVLEL